MRTVALQLYTVRHALAQDLRGTLRRIREAGYTAVETAPLPDGLTPGDMAKHLCEFELTVVAAHVALPLGERQSVVLDEMQALGASRMIWSGWPRDPDASSREGYRRLADRYAEAATVAQRHGFAFGLHTHWWEWEAVEGGTPFDWLHAWLPRSVFVELDVYWARTAGMDPLQAMDRLGSRLGMLHLKDGPAIHGQPMTPLGEGVVNLPAILKASAPECTWVVELDECATDPVEAAAQSLRYLQAGRSPADPAMEPRRDANGRE